MQEEEEVKAEDQQPFLLMLQFGLEALLLSGLKAGQQPADALPPVARILRALKRTRDASADPKTENMCAA